MKQLLTTAILTTTLATSAFAQIDLVSLGSSTFTVDPGATTASYTQSGSGIIFNGTYALGDTLGGTFATQDWSNPAYTEFGVTMTLTGSNPNLPFSVQFYDAAFNVINTYGGTTVPLVAGSPTYTPLSLNIPGTGILTSVAGVQFTLDGGGAINTTVETVSAVPEPSTYALLVLGGLALSAYRLRRHAVRP
jgi:hypothetical protein